MNSKWTWMGVAVAIALASGAAFLLLSPGQNRVVIADVDAGASEAANLPIIQVDVDGAVTWNGSALGLESDLPAFMATIANSANPSIRIQADMSAEYFQFGRVLEEAQKAGVLETTSLPSGLVLKTPLPPPPTPDLDPQLLDAFGCPAAVEMQDGNFSGPYPVRLAVNLDGSVSWNGAIVDQTTLEENLWIEARRDPQREIHIELDREAKYAAFDKVLAAVKPTHLCKVGIIGGT